VRQLSVAKEIPKRKNNKKPEKNRPQRLTKSHPKNLSWSFEKNKVTGINRKQILK
jgi:hypothetical protein